jgi:hypothetical protein
VDTSAFAGALDGVFAGPLADGRPADIRFAEITADVAGHSTPAELALLNLAARLLPEGEAYLEVGALKGRSMAGALLDAPYRSYVTVESFREFGMLAEASRAELAANLDRYGGGRRVIVREGDCFAVMAAPGRSRAGRRLLLRRRAHGVGALPRPRRGRAAAR